MNQSVANVPRYRVTMNGTILEGVVQVSAMPPIAFQVGKFRIVKAFVPDDAFPASWWAATANKTMLISIEMAVDGVTFHPMITGNVDSHKYDAIGNTITAVGRDLAAGMLDTRIVTTYRNKTSSEIAAMFAAEHSLKTNITPTPNFVGRYYDTDHDETNSGNFSPATNEWDLLCRLGDREGIIPYVFGTTLYFNPPADNPPMFPVSLTRDSYGLLVANVIGLDLTRNMTAARDVVVTVRSWHSRQKTTFSATVRTKTKDASTDATLPPSKYLRTIPNLTQAQCLAMAKKYALDISQHERNASISIPSLALMDPQTVIPLSGTGTDYDMTFYPLTISYDIDFKSGASTTVQAKFSSPLFLYDDDTGEQIREQS